MTSTELSAEIYVADCTAEPDFEFPDYGLLEIALPREIDVAKWKLDHPNPAEWNEFAIPYWVLNGNVKLRLVPRDEWLEMWENRKRAQSKYAFEKLAQMGLLERVKDDQGQPLFRDGQPVWVVSEKGRNLTKAEFDELFDRVWDYRDSFNFLI